MFYYFIKKTKMVMSLYKTTLININSTMPLLDKIQPLLDLLKKYPKTFLGVTAFGLGILALRKIHHRFIMFPCTYHEIQK